MLDGYARCCREVLDRSAPLHHALRSAAAVHPEAAALLARVEHHRLVSQSGVARALAERGAVLADGVTEDEARDVIFTMTAPEVHRILTVQALVTGPVRALAGALAARAAPPPHTRLIGMSTRCPGDTRTPWASGSFP